MYDEYPRSVIDSYVELLLVLIGKRQRCILLGFLRERKRNSEARTGGSLNETRGSAKVIANRRPVAAKDSESPYGLP